MNGFWSALAFLTCCPVPQRLLNEDGLRRAARWFPLVGILIGVACSMVGYSLAASLPPLPMAVLCTACMALASRGLHLDGLADTADGLLSHRTRTQMLEIMRDSRIGAMGVLALLFVLGLKVACLASLPKVELLIPALILAPVCGRTALLVVMSRCPYARREGLSSLLYAGFIQRHTSVGVLLAIICGAALLGLYGVIAVGFSLCIAVGCASVYKRILGGATGDTLGATCEIVEMTTLLILVYLSHSGIMDAV